MGPMSSSLYQPNPTSGTSVSSPSPSTYRSAKMQWLNSRLSSGVYDLNQNQAINSFNPISSNGNSSPNNIHHMQLSSSSSNINRVSSPIDVFHADHLNIQHQQRNSGAPPSPHSPRRSFMSPLETNVCLTHYDH